LDENIIVDNTGFIEIVNKHDPNFIMKEIRDSLYPQLINNNYFKCFGYKFNIKSTIFAEAIPQELIKGWNNIIDSEQSVDIIDSFFELELFNYKNILAGMSGFLFPILNLLKLCYWYNKCNNNLGSQSKLRKIKQELLAKSQVLSHFERSSEALQEYDNLINFTSDAYSELMFATLCKINGYTISFEKNKDFIVNQIDAEVKSFHDKPTVQNMKLYNNMYYRELPDGFTLHNLKIEMTNQIKRNKFEEHLKKAIRQGKIIFFNITEAYYCHFVSMFLEQNNLRKNFDEILKIALSLTNRKDTVPVIIVLENTGEIHFISFIIFNAPIKNNGQFSEVDQSKFTNQYIYENIII
jgi:hypothetical protein